MVSLNNKSSFKKRAGRTPLSNQKTTTSKRENSKTEIKTHVIQFADRLRVDDDSLQSFIFWLASLGEWRKVDKRPTQRTRGKFLWIKINSLDHTKMVWQSCANLQFKVHELGPTRATNGYQKSFVWGNESIATTLPITSDDNDAKCVTTHTVFEKS
jgi:hypothetical protein